MIEFVCPHCNQTLQIPEQYAGQSGQCNHCQRTIDVPEAPQEGQPQWSSTQSPESDDGLTIRQTLFSFKGRIGRQTYWTYQLQIVILAFFAGFISIAMGRVNELDPETLQFRSLLFPIAISVIIFWPLLALQVKRWHDRGKSGWWTLITLIPGIGAAWQLVELGFLEGTYDDNRFGPIPE